MKILFTEDVLEEERWFPIFDVLTMLVEEGRHSFDADRVKVLLDSAWIASRPRDVHDLVRLSSTKRSYDKDVDLSRVLVDRDCRRGGLLNRTTSTTHLHPLDVIGFLATPFQVIVENEWADGAFLFWMARAVGYHKLIDAYRSRRFVFRHAGGKTGIVRCAKVLSHGVWPRADGAYSNAREFWACVFLDSDEKFPDHSPNQEIIAQVAPLVTFVHQLRKRSIESYLPKDFLLAYANSGAFRQSVEAVFRLSDVQKTHYHMKTGFRYDASDPPQGAYLASMKVTPEEKLLFGGIPAADWAWLKGGFGSGLSEIYIDERYRPNRNDPRLADQGDRREMLDLCLAIYERL